MAQTSTEKLPCPDTLVLPFTTIAARHGTLGKVLQSIDTNIYQGNTFSIAFDMPIKSSDNCITVNAQTGHNFKLTQSVKLGFDEGFGGIMPVFDRGGMSINVEVFGQKTIMKDLSVAGYPFTKKDAFTWKVTIGFGGDANDYLSLSNGSVYSSSHKHYQNMISSKQSSTTDEKDDQ
eukprot:452202_1